MHHNRNPLGELNDSGYGEIRKAIILSVSHANHNWVCLLIDSSYM